MVGGPEGALADQGSVALQARAQAERGMVDRWAKREALDLACDAFFQEVEFRPEAPMVCAYLEFLQNSDFWLEDYVRFHAFRQSQQQRCWAEWPRGLRDRDPNA